MKALYKMFDWTEQQLKLVYAITNLQYTFL